MSQKASSSLQKQALEYIADCFGVEMRDSYSNGGTMKGLAFIDSDNAPHDALAPVSIPIEELEKAIGKAEERVEKTTEMEAFSRSTNYECAASFEASRWNPLPTRSDISLQLSHADISYAIGPYSIEYCLFRILRYLQEGANGKDKRLSGQFRSKIMRARRPFGGIVPRMSFSTKRMPSTGNRHCPTLLAFTAFRSARSMS